MMAGGRDVKQPFNCLKNLMSNAGRFRVTPCILF